MNKIRINPSGMPHQDAKNHIIRSSVDPVRVIINNVIWTVALHLSSAERMTWLADWSGHPSDLLFDEKSLFWTTENGSRKLACAMPDKMGTRAKKKTSEGRAARTLHVNACT
jgi:hypothetical protein